MITKVTAADFAARFPNAKAYEMPSLERPMVEVHKATGQIYTRTRRAFESTRTMAAKLGPATARKLERSYDVFELAE